MDKYDTAPEDKGRKPGANMRIPDTTGREIGKFTDDNSEYSRLTETGGDAEAIARRKTTIHESGNRQDQKGREKKKRPRKRDKNRTMDVARRKDQ